MASQYPLFTPVQYNGETTYGTSGTPNTAIGSVQNIAPTNANSFTYVRGTNRAVQKAIYGQYTTGFSGTFLLHDFTFLRHFVGPYDSGSDTFADPKTLTTGDSTSVNTSTGIQAFSLELGNTITDEKTTYLGCQGNDFSISGSEGQALQCSFNAIASTNLDDDLGVTAYTEPTTQPWIFSQGTFKYGTTPFEVTDLMSFDITYSNNLIQHWGAGNGRFMKQPIAGSLDITWSASVRATSGYYQYIRDSFFGQSDSPNPADSSATPPSDQEVKLELDEGSTRGADIYLTEVVIDSMSNDISVGTDNIVTFTVSGRANIGESSKPIRWWSGARS